MTAQSLLALLEAFEVRALRIRGRNVMGCCPYHEESRPSWGMCIEPPYLHACFSCGKKGTLRSFLYERQAPLELILRLNLEAEAAVSVDGFELEAKTTRPPVVDPGAAQFPRAWRVSAAYIYLLRRGIRPAQMRASDLRWDSEQQRVLFPWWRADTLYGVTGRAVDPTARKTLPYFNTAKSAQVYLPMRRLDHPDPPAWAGVALCEGELDALALAQTVTPNVAAFGMGTLAEAALAAVFELRPDLEKVLLAFDDDPTGKRLTRIAARYFAERGVRARHLNYRLVQNRAKTNKDPAALSPQELLLCVRREA